MALRTLVDVDTLAAHLDDPRWVVLDCRFELTRPTWGEEAFAAGHIPGAQYAHLDRICGEVMSASGFHRCEDGDPTAAAIKNMLRRIQMSEREMRIMLALFNRMRISLERVGS